MPFVYSDRRGSSALLAYDPNHYGMEKALFEGHAVAAVAATTASIAAKAAKLIEFRTDVAGVLASGALKAVERARKN
jgi:hypothetical protein